ncbi:hypothetical protein ES702_05533 [subsurface metagenome]
MDYKIKLPKQKKGRKTVKEQNIYELELKDFANKLKELQYIIAGTRYIKDKDKISARGWCYLLEGFGAITKDQFDKSFKLINFCRKEGYLPIDFVAQDSSREFFNVESLTEEYTKPLDYLVSYLMWVKKCDKSKKDVAFWESQKYYIQVMVEKLDVRNLFIDVCEKYHIPISNAKGWSDMLSRNDMIIRFKQAEGIGLIPVLLYYGDFDPAGIKIAETLRKNIMDLEKATKWTPKNLIIDHFGLTIDFINDNGILWIDNLITGGKRNLGLLYEQYKCGKKGVKLYDYEINYIEKYGVRKCEANAILPFREVAIKQCEAVIIKYLGDNPFEVYDKKVKRIQKEITKLMRTVNVKKRVRNLVLELIK